MYNSFFDLKTNPFSPNPDPAVFFPSQQHDTALRSLTFAVQSRMGLAFLSGPAGAGKTLLLEALRDTLEGIAVPCAFLPESRISTSRFFQAIASQLKLSCQSASAYQVFSALHQFAVEQTRKGRTLALIVDDAQDLPPDILGEILHLASLGDGKIGLLQTVLAGRSEFQGTLDALNLERLNQRAILSCRLEPFTAEETKQYVDFRLAKAGLARQTIFPPEVLAEIHHLSEGLAPAIHTICERLLLAAFSSRSKVCTPEMLAGVFGTRTEETPVREIRAIDRARRIAAPESVPPPPPAALLSLTIAPIQSSPPPLPLNASAMFAAACAAPTVNSLSRELAPPAGNFLRPSKRSMQFTRPVAGLQRIPPKAHAISAVLAHSELVLSRPAFSAEPLGNCKLRKLGVIEAEPLGSQPAVRVLPIDFATAALQPDDSVLRNLSANHHPPLQRKRLPILPFGPADCAAILHSSSVNCLNPLVNRANPAGPNMPASRRANAPNQADLSRLPCAVSAAAPSGDETVPCVSGPMQSLRPLGPACRLEALSPRNSWLLLPNWQPAEEASRPTDAAVQSSPLPLASLDRKWLLTLAIPIISALALYSLLQGMPASGGVLNQAWQRAHQAVLGRAAVTLQEDFRAGLDDWTNRGGGRPSWTADAAGFVHPGTLALYRPSLGLTDYQMQFVGTIDKKALSWVVRAADFDNYYAVRLGVLKPGPVPVIGLVRYAVVNGKPRNQMTTPLAMSARPDTVYRVRLDVRGDRFSLSLQDQTVDSWSEPRLRQGGIGFFSEQDADSRVTAVQVSAQHDMLGKLCAFFAPPDVVSYRASLNERAAINLTPAANTRSGGRGAVSSSSSGNGYRTTRRARHLDPAVWKAPEVNVPNARRCGSGSGRVVTGRTRHTSRVSSSAPCY